jgi:hypothetical protein
MTSRKPAVVSMLVRATRPWIRALVATVVPWPTKPTSAPWHPAAESPCAMPRAIASDGSCGVELSFHTASLPLAGS